MNAQDLYMAIFPEFPETSLQDLELVQAESTEAEWDAYCNDWLDKAFVALDDETDHWGSQYDNL